MQDIENPLYSRPEAKLISPFQAVAFSFPGLSAGNFFVPSASLPTLLKPLELFSHTPCSRVILFSSVSSKLELTFQKNITFFVGENTTGKSSLLEAIAVAYGYNPEGGTINYRISTNDDYSELHNAVRLVKSYRRALTGYFFRAESFFNLATKADEYDRENRWGPSFGGRSLHAQSHGESFLSFFQTFKSAGLYLMDEPEAALSPQRQLTLLLHIKLLAEQGSQFIVASHSPILLGIPDAQIYSFDGGVIHEISWEETESYRLTKLFLDHRESVLKQLLK